MWATDHHTAMISLKELNDHGQQGWLFNEKTLNGAQNSHDENVINLGILGVMGLRKNGDDKIWEYLAIKSKQKAKAIKYFTR